MKKIVSFLVLCVVATTLMVSCDTLVEESFDETLLAGKWQSGSLFYIYLNDGSGAMWDTKVDVTEAKVQRFTWTIVQSELTQINLMKSGETATPKIYTITELTDSTLKYYDELGDFSFKKVADIVEHSFDETLLFGKWQSGTLFYKFISDGSGSTWDTSDDVTETEAQGFKWTLIASELIYIHILEIGGWLPKVYTVTELTESTLIYEDDFGKEFSFDKVVN
jgi:hypothetical protein